VNASERRETVLRRGAVAFDVDGVLLQGLFLSQAAWRKGLMVWAGSLRLGLLHKLGFLSVKDVVERAYALQRGSRMSDVLAVAESVRLVRGAREVCAELKALGYTVVFVSVGVPNEVVERLAARLGADGGAGALLEVEDGVLTGRVVGGRHSEAGKRESLERMLRQAGFGWTETTVVVDDRSNSEIVRAAWRSIGVNPELPILRDASFVLHTRDLREILQFFPEGYEVGVTPQRLAVRHEASRKAIHACAAIVPTLALLSKAFTLWLVGGVTGLFVLSEWFRLFGVAVPVLSRVTWATMRPSEPRRVVLGPILYGIGIFLTLALFPRAGATVGILILAVGDSVASLAGRAFGSTTLPHNPGKTLIGSFSLFAVGVIIAMFFVSVPWALAVGAAAAVVESLSVGAADNLLLPVVSASVVTLARATH
jgi:dolichol kinase/phosphoserine phosphatase